MDINWPTIVLQTLGFFLLVGVLSKFLYRPILEMLDKRADQANKLLDKAEEQGLNAEASLKSAKDELHVAKQDAMQLRNDARSMAQKEREEILDRGKNEAEHLVRNAHEDIVHEMKKVRQELKAEVAQVAVAISQKVLMREITPEDRERYIGTFRKDVEETYES